MCRGANPLHQLLRFAQRIAPERDAFLGTDPSSSIRCLRSRHTGHTEVAHHQVHHELERRVVVVMKDKLILTFEPSQEPTKQSCARKLGSAHDEPVAVSDHLKQRDAIDASLGERGHSHSSKCSEYVADSWLPSLLDTHSLDLFEEGFHPFALFLTSLLRSSRECSAVLEQAPARLLDDHHRLDMMTRNDGHLFVQEGVEAI